MENYFSFKLTHQQITKKQLKIDWKFNRFDFNVMIFIVTNFLATNSTTSTSTSKILVFLKEYFSH